ncbi:MAG: c-type cytochrome [Nitrospirota bacterium]
MHRRVRVSEVVMSLALAVSSGVNGLLAVPVNAHDVAKPPGSSVERANPLPHSDAVVGAGQGLYQKVCASCHGASGSGDTPAASGFAHQPPDFTKGLNSRTDGELFWAITKGGGIMPGYERTLSEEQRWQVIHYLRTLAAPQSGPQP